MKAAVVTTNLVAAIAWTAILVSYLTGHTLERYTIVFALVFAIAGFVQVAVRELR